MASSDVAHEIDGLYELADRVSDYLKSPDQYLRTAASMLSAFIRKRVDELLEFPDLTRVQTSALNIAKRVLRWAEDPEWRELQGVRYQDPEAAEDY